MVIPDVNLLLYSQNPGAREHAAAVAWLQNVLRGPDIFGLTWLTMWAFVRIASNPRIWAKPAPKNEVFDRIEEWRSLPNVTIVHPGPRHQVIFRALMEENNVSGTLTTDAALAAIAIEHAATLASSDRDFRRFSGLRWVNPLE